MADFTGVAQPLTQTRITAAGVHQFVAWYSWALGVTNSLTAVSSGTSTPAVTTGQLWPR
jgi:hypothetical protein